MHYVLASKLLFTFIEQFNIYSLHMTSIREISFYILSYFVLAVAHCVTSRQCL